MELGRLDRAEALLATAQGPQAQGMRERLAIARQERAQLLDSLEALLEDAAQGEQGAAGALSELGRAAKGAWEREQIAIARSRAADLQAELRRAGPLAKKQRSVIEEHDSDSDQATPEEDELTLLVFADVRQAMADRKWAKAEEELLGIRKSLETSFPAFSVLEEELKAALALDVERVLAAARREQTLRGARAELAYLGDERWHFLMQGAGSAVHERWIELAEDLGEALDFTPNFTNADTGHSLGPQAEKALEHAVTEALPAPSDSEPAVAPAAVRIELNRPKESWGARTSTLAIEARRLVREGQLNDAADRYQQAALQSKGAEQTRFGARARDARARAMLRAKLLRAFEAKPFPGLSEIGETGLILAGIGRDWADLEASELLAMSNAAGIEDSLGLTLELLGLYDGSGQEEGGRRLHEAELEQLVGGGERNEWLALHKGQARMPQGGYLWEDGQWKTATEADAAALGKQLVKLGQDLERGKLERRNFAFAELESLAVAHLAAAESLRVHLSLRLERARRTLMSSRILRRLESMAGRRALLDARRVAVLALIEDEVNYFYPYQMPAVSSEEAAAYWEVQRRISGMLGVLAMDWSDKAGSVSLDSSFREALENLIWCLGKLETSGGMLRLPEGLPSWIEGVDPGLEQLALAQFAWSREEALELRLGRSIRARNRELWEQLEASRKLSGEESEQVRLTNEYRLMLGRLPLGWNPMLQAAASTHSEYMSRTGRFGHTQEGAIDRTPEERRHRRGYVHDGGENCHVGSRGPQGVHDSWLESSAHHRNVVSSEHHEIGVALEGTFWTQVFGSGDGWVDSLR